MTDDLNHLTEKLKLTGCFQPDRLHFMKKGCRRSQFKKTQADKRNLFEVNRTGYQAAKNPISITVSRTFITSVNW